jgi:hypothetical protein
MRKLIFEVGIKLIIFYSLYETVLIVLLYATRELARNV